ncbi:MAG: hypothetical protein FWE14_03535 [Lachnospiraceae bacterium]|nr:hypothetical protein [Lachnospiraceae bacterium]
MRNVLPLEKKPPIVAYQHHAFHLGIMVAVKEYQHHFLSNYINLYYHSQANNKINFATEINWFGNEVYFQINRIGYSHNLDLLSRQELINVVIKMIDINCYCLGNYDEYYIPKTYSFNEKHFIHDFLIHGYDKEKELFYIMGYTNENLYESITINFCQFADAVFSIKKDNWINFIRVDPDYIFKFDIVKMKRLMIDYLESRDSYNQFDEKICTFGINAIKKFALNLKTDPQLIDLRYFKLLVEHKKCMHSRLVYLYENKYILDAEISNEYMEIVNSYKLAFNIVLRTGFTNSMSKINKARDMIILSIDKEVDILNKILTNL